MGKYENVLQGVLNVFNLDEWKALNIATYPENFTRNSTIKEWIRVSVIPSSLGANKKSISGIVLINIFTPINKGPLQATRVLDLLDAFLSNADKRIDTNKSIQFYVSTAHHVGVDSDDPTLFSTIYSIPFKYFEVM